MNMQITFIDGETSELEFGEGVPQELIDSFVAKSAAMTKFEFNGWLHELFNQAKHASWLERLSKEAEQNEQTPLAD